MASGMLDAGVKAAVDTSAGYDGDIRLEADGALNNADRYTQLEMANPEPEIATRGRI